MIEKLLVEKRLLDIEENLKRVTFDVTETAVSAGRNPEDIKIMAVTKTVEPVFINHALNNGINLIGENRVQEFLEKFDHEMLEKCQAHIIGHLQTNKVRQIIGKVNMIQSVDSMKLVKEIAKRSVEKQIVSDILFEVNIAGETSKFGFQPDEIMEAVYETAGVCGVKLHGLMAVPPIFDNSEKIHSFFSDMHHLFLDIRMKKIDNVSMDILSLGMSNDFKQAITQGSTLVRLGSAVFGARIY